jgi:hypothetical protein
MEFIQHLSVEAHRLHGVFAGLFYSIVLTILSVGVVFEYFRIPIGGVPSFWPLLGRSVVAALLFAGYSEITDAIGQSTDELANAVGDFSTFDKVLSRTSEKIDQLTVSWVSVKDSLVLGLSFLSFFLLYFTKFVAEGLYAFVWILCYIASPFLIALYVLPATAQATTSLFRTLIEVSFWKIGWAVLATLLWSSALSELNSTTADTNFLSVICLNLVMAGSLVATPWVVHAFVSSGLTVVGRSLTGIAVGATVVSPAMLRRGLSRSVDKIQNYRNRSSADTDGLYPQWGRSNSKSVSEA